MKIIGNLLLAVGIAYVAIVVLSVAMLILFMLMNCVAQIL